MRSEGSSGVHSATRRGDLVVVEVDVQAPAVDVDRDVVALAHRGDRAAAHRLGGDVAGHEAVGGAAEAPVGEQGHVLAQPGAVDRRRDREHLAHAGAAGGALVADDDDVAGLDPALRHGLHRALLAVEDARRAAVVAPLVPGELHDAPVGREVPAQDGQAAGGLDGVAQRPDDLLARGLLRGARVVADRHALDGDGVLLEQPGLGEALEEHRDAAGGAEVDGVVARRPA